MRPVSNLAFYLLLIESSLAIFENPFLLRSLFGKLFQIESKIREINVGIDDRNVQILLEKVSTFRNEIDVASKVAGYAKDSKADGYIGKDVLWYGRNTQFRSFQLRGKGAKGQLISKANCQAVNSSNERMNEFVFTTVQRVLVCFSEEIEDSKKVFRNYLTFSEKCQLNKLH